MKLTDALVAEHGVFYAQLDFVEAALLDPGTLERVRNLAAMLAATLAPHSRAEDELLYPAFSGVPRSDPVAVIHEEHEEIAETLEAVAKVSDLSSAAELLREAVWMVREHCWHEEQVAFPLAEERLGADALCALGEKWVGRRAPQPVA